jgi:two-component system sensor kinase FixL
MLRARIHPEDRVAQDAAIQRAIVTKGGFDIEFRLLLPNDAVRWISARARCVDYGDGKPARLLSVAIDVTKRKEAEELFRLVTEAAPSGILLANEEGRIVLVNAHLEALFGYKREELIGQMVEILVPDRFAAEYSAFRTAFLANPEQRAMGSGRELLARRKDGTEFPAEIGLNSIRTPQGLLVLASVVDISQRRQAAEELRRQREQINLLSRVSLLGEMTASLAHELNQPLSAIITNANAGMRSIDKGKEDPGTLREILVDVEADGRRAHDIIRNVRNTVKKSDPTLRRINLNELVTKVAHIVRPDAVAYSCEVKTSLAKDLPLIEGDPVQIQQVLVNLVSNALDAMRHTPPDRRKVEISTAGNGDNEVRLSVRDHGTGIRTEVHERLFDRFFTTKEQGLGMGLAIVRSIVESHGGDIQAENVADGGARFYFTLPVKKRT